MKFLIKKRLNIILIILIPGIMVISGIYYYMFLRPLRDVSKMDPEYKLSSQQLISEFSNEEAAANAKYLGKENGKVIQVKGKISEIKLENNGIFTCTLRDKPEIEASIICYLDSLEANKIKRYHTGDFIVIKGTCIGWVYLTSEVDLIKCIIVE